MADQIRVLIVDDIPETRDHLTKLLGFESDIEVVGSAASGSEALSMAGKMLPDVVMMSVQGEADYLRRSMLAGAREFLVKPFSSDELTASIRQVYTRERDKQTRMNAMPVISGTPGGGSTPAGEDDGRNGQIIALFSPKGGVGRTTVAVNLAVAAATDL